MTTPEPIVGPSVSTLRLTVVPGQAFEIQVGPWPGGLPVGTWAAVAGLDLAENLTVTDDGNGTPTVKVTLGTVIRDLAVLLRSIPPRLAQLARR